MATKKKNGTSLPAKTGGLVPAYVQGDLTEDGSHLGLEEMRSRDLMIPRLVLMQALSPQVQEDVFKAGDVVNSVTQELVFGKGEEIEICPIIHYLEWIEWGSRDSGEGILERSRDPNGELAKAAAQREEAERDGKTVIRVTEYHNFVCYLCVNEEWNLDDAVVLGFSKSNWKHGRRLLNLAHARKGAPLFAGRYKLSTPLEKNNKGQTYHVFMPANAGWVPEDVYERARESFEFFEKYRAEISAQFEDRDDDGDRDDGKTREY